MGNGQSTRGRRNRNRQDLNGSPDPVRNGTRRRRRAAEDNIPSMPQPAIPEEQESLSSAGGPSCHSVLRHRHRLSTDSRLSAIAGAMPDYRQSDDSLRSWLPSVTQLHHEVLASLQNDENEVIEQAMLNSYHQHTQTSMAANSNVAVNSNMAANSNMASMTANSGMGPSARQEENGIGHLENQSQRTQQSALRRRLSSVASDLWVPFSPESSGTGWDLVLVIMWGLFILPILAVYWLIKIAYQEWNQAGRRPVQTRTGTRSRPQSNPGSRAHTNNRRCLSRSNANRPAS